MILKLGLAKLGLSVNSLARPAGLSVSDSSSVLHKLADQSGEGPVFQSSVCKYLDYKYGCDAHSQSTDLPQNDAIALLGVANRVTANLQILSSCYSNLANSISAKHPALAINCIDLTLQAIVSGAFKPSARSIIKLGLGIADYACRSAEALTALTSFFKVNNGLSTSDIKCFRSLDRQINSSDIQGIDIARVYAEKLEGSERSLLNKADYKKLKSLLSVIDSPEQLIRYIESFEFGHGADTVQARRSSLNCQLDTIEKLSRLTGCRDLDLLLAFAEDLGGLNDRTLSVVKSVVSTEPTFSLSHKWGTSFIKNLRKMQLADNIGPDSPDFIPAARALRSFSYSCEMAGIDSQYAYKSLKERLAILDATRLNRLANNLKSEPQIADTYLAAIMAAEHIEFDFKAANHETKVGDLAALIDSGFYHQLSTLFPIRKADSANQNRAKHTLPEYLNLLSLRKSFLPEPELRLIRKIMFTFPDLIKHYVLIFERLPLADNSVQAAVVNHEPDDATLNKLLKPLHKIINRHPYFMNYMLERFNRETHLAYQDLVDLAELAKNKNGIEILNLCSAFETQFGTVQSCLFQHFARIDEPGKFLESLYALAEHRRDVPVADRIAKNLKDQPDEVRRKLTGNLILKLAYGID